MNRKVLEAWTLALYIAAGLMMWWPELRAWWG